MMSEQSDIVEIREHDLVATARAGTSLFEIDAELRERGRRFPLKPHDAGDRATVGGSFAAAADDPSSSLMRSQAISTVQDFLGDTARINTQIAQLGKTVDAQASADTADMSAEETVNSAEANAQIVPDNGAAATEAGAGSQTLQATPTVWVVLAWTAVGLPLAWGVYRTFLSVLKFIN